jgi:serine/threonine protein kinase
MFVHRIIKNVGEENWIFKHQRLRLSDRYRLGYYLRELGSFGRVRMVKKKNTTRYSCVKIMKKEEIIRAQQVDHISNEYKILSSINHPFIVDVG